MMGNCLLVKRWFQKLRAALMPYTKSSLLGLNSHATKRVLPSTKSQPRQEKYPTTKTKQKSNKENKTEKLGNLVHIFGLQAEPFAQERGYHRPERHQGKPSQTSLQWGSFLGGKTEQRLDSLTPMGVILRNNK